MTQTLPAFARRFYAYQKERFPVIPLALSLIPAVLSSGAVLFSHPPLLQGALAVAASVLYLLHIRIIDEHRDFAHDNRHHASRPVQSGVITKQELHRINIAVVLLLSAIAVFGGVTAVIVLAIMLSYSYLAGKEFFIGEKLRKRFFLYNAVNVVQMFLMQAFVYALLSQAVMVSAPLIAHFLFTSVGTVLFEFGRKIKIPGEDGSGEDTYTWYLGFRNSLLIFTALAGLNALLFWQTAVLSDSSSALWAFVALAVFLWVAGAVLLHGIRKTRTTDRLMQITFFLAYGVCNIALFLLYA